MPNLRKYLLLFLLVVATLSIYLIYSARIAFTEKSAALSLNNMTEEEHREPAQNQCWFTNPNSYNSVSFDIIEKRQNRETYGYPADINLSDAIAIFNEEQQCYPFLSILPPLTEDEVVAAITAGADYGRDNRIWKSQEDILTNITSQKILPKGTLLVGEGGGVINPVFEGNTAIGRRIYLFLKLDKNPREAENLKPEQIFLIRKNFFKTERFIK